MPEEQKISFKTRVLETAISYSKGYYSLYVSLDYLIISDAFHIHPYYIVSAEKSNYLHLLGVSTGLSASDFFEKCYNGTLTEDDFEIADRNFNRKE